LKKSDFLKWWNCPEKARFRGRALFSAKNEVALIRRLALDEMDNDQGFRL
jgi:hypothetical protein